MMPARYRTKPSCAANGVKCHVTWLVELKERVRLFQKTFDLP
jgi:hypothetical protein